MNEIITIDDTAKGELDIKREPQIVLAEARKAAEALNDVLSKKKNPVKFNGNQYLEFEDWQTVGRFYGLSARTSDPQYYEIDGVKGAKAKAEVINVNTGQVIGTAEAWCLRDEPNWARKPWGQLASMAQTRAGAKALRNVLSWVVVLAGYKPTPAEELPSTEKESFQPQAKPTIDEIMENDAIEPIGPTSRAPRQKKEGTISEAQGKRFYAIYKKAGKSDNEVKEFLTTTFGISDSRDMRWQDYQAACDWAEGK